VAQKMKNAENKEIDLLLKDFANRLDRKQQAIGEHLDADELSSFAEGVLPAATRSLYTAHLADCERCREIVTHLAVASGEAFQQKHQTTERAGVWSFLAEIFTPKVMRYALPALSVLIVAAIGLMLLRQRQPEHVARPNQTAVSTPATAPLDDQVAQSREAPAVGQSARSETSPKKQVESKTREAAAEDERAKDVNKAPTENDSLSAESKNAAGSKREVARNETRPAVAGRVMADAPAPSPAKAKEAAAEANEETVKRPDQPAPSVTVSKSADREVRDREQEAAKKTTIVGGFSSLRRQMPSVDKSKSDAQSAETRNVAGRRFRRVDNGWVDTEYNSSAAVTNVARGSEQYRALIGDEPGLRTISEELDGIVTVVWKGKAYRIR
jgi:hypothetical protein